MCGEERIARAQSPEVRRLPVREEFQPVGFPMQAVAFHARNEQVDGCGISLDGHSSRFNRDQVAIAVVKTSRVQRELAGPCIPVACLERREPLVLLVWIPKKANKYGQAAGPRNGSVIYAQIGVVAGRSAVGAGDCTPDHVLAVRSPRQAPRRFDAKSGVVVVLEPRAQAKVKAVRAEGDVILRKRTEELGTAAQRS